MLSIKHSKRIFLKLISVAIIHVFLLTNMGFAFAESAQHLSAGSRINPIANTENAHLFKESAVFYRISMLIGKYLALGISEHTLITDIKEIIAEAELRSAEKNDRLLAGFKVDEITFNESEHAFSIPIYRNDIKTFEYKYSLTGDQKTADIAIPVGEGTTVYIQILPTGVPGAPEMRASGKTAEINPPQDKYSYAVVLRDREAVLRASQGNPSVEALQVLEHPGEARWGDTFNAKIYYELYSYLAHLDSADRPVGPSKTKLQRIVDAAIWNSLGFSKDSDAGKAVSEFFISADEGEDSETIGKKFQNIKANIRTLSDDSRTREALGSIVRMCYTMYADAARFGARIKDGVTKTAAGDEHELLNPITLLLYNISDAPELLRDIDLEGRYERSLNTYLGTAYNLLTKNARTSDDLEFAIKNYRYAINIFHFKKVTSVFTLLPLLDKTPIDPATADQRVVADIFEELNSLEMQGFPDIPEVRGALNLTAFGWGQIARARDRSDEEAIFKTLSGQKASPANTAFLIKSLTRLARKFRDTKELDEETQRKIEKQINTFLIGIGSGVIKATVFKAIVLPGQAQNAKPRAWLLGFNTIPAPPGISMTDGISRFLAQDLAKMYPNTLALSKETLYQIQGSPDTLDEFIFHELCCPVFGHEKTRMIQETMFPENHTESAAGGKPGHRTGALTRALQLVIDNENPAATANPKVWSKYWEQSDKRSAFGADRPPQSIIDFISAGFDRIFSGDKNIRRVADIGCGNLFFSREILQKEFSAKEIIGIDPAISIQPDIPGITVVKNQLEDAGYADEFDAALMSYALMYMRNKEKALDRLHTMLKPGAKAVLVIHHPQSSIMKNMREMNEYKTRTISAFLKFLVDYTMHPNKYTEEDAGERLNKALEPSISKTGNWKKYLTDILAYSDGLRDELTARVPGSFEKAQRFSFYLKEASDRFAQEAYDSRYVLGEAQNLFTTYDKVQTMLEKHGFVIADKASPDGLIREKNDILGYGIVVQKPDDPAISTGDIQPSVGSETVQALMFSDVVKLIENAAKNTANQPDAVILALGRSWIKGYTPGTQSYKDLNRLIIAIRNYCEARGIAFVDADDEDLLKAIGEKKKVLIGGIKKDAAAGYAPNIKTIVLASKNSVAPQDAILAPLRNDDNAFLAGVDNSSLDEQCYVRLVEMLRITLEIGLKELLKKKISIENPYIAISALKDFKNVYIFLPKAQRIPVYDNMRLLYKAQIFA